MTARVVVGVGLSSKATAAEVAALVDEVLEAGDELALVATRARFADDVRLQLGPPVVGFEDEDLVAASDPPERTVGLPAKVAETAARLAGGQGEGTVHRSAHATAVVLRLAAD